MKTTKLLIKLLSEISYVPETDIQLDTHIFSDLDIDSIGLVELFVNINSNFTVKLDPMIYSRDQIDTPDKLINIIHYHLK